MIIIIDYIHKKKKKKKKHYYRIHKRLNELIELYDLALLGNWFQVAIAEGKKERWR